MKTPHRSTKRKKETNKETPIRAIPDCYTWNLVPVMDNAPEVWAQELREFVKDNPHVRTFRDFFDAKQIYRKTFYAMIERFPVLKQAHEEAKMTLGERLWESSVDRKTDWRATHHRLWRYGKEFEEDDTYHLELAKQKNEELAKSLVSGILHSNKDKIHDSNK